MQFASFKVVMLCISTMAFASPPPHVKRSVASPPHMAAVSVKDNGFPEVVDLKEIIELEIADADRFTNLREAEWQLKLRGIQAARDQVHGAVEHMNAKNKSVDIEELRSEVLPEILDAKEKLHAQEESMLLGSHLNDIRQQIHNASKEIAQLNAPQQQIQDASQEIVHLNDIRQQIQEARSKLHSEPLPPFAQDEEEEKEAAQEAIKGADELLKVPSDLLPTPVSHKDEDKIKPTPAPKKNRAGFAESEMHHDEDYLHSLLDKDHFEHHPVVQIPKGRKGKDPATQSHKERPTVAPKKKRAGITPVKDAWHHDGHQDEDHEDYLHSLLDGDHSEHDRTVSVPNGHKDEIQSQIEEDVKKYKKKLEKYKGKLEEYKGKLKDEEGKEKKKGRAMIIDFITKKEYQKKVEKYEKKVAKYEEKLAKKVKDVKSPSKAAEEKRFVGFKEGEAIWWPKVPSKKNRAGADSESHFDEDYLLSLISEEDVDKADHQSQVEKAAQAASSTEEYAVPPEVWEYKKNRHRPGMEHSKAGVEDDHHSVEALHQLLHQPHQEEIKLEKPIRAGKEEEMEEQVSHEALHKPSREENANGPCVDDPDWVDADGDGCAVYADHIAAESFTQDEACMYGNGNARDHCRATCGTCIYDKHAKAEKLVEKQIEVEQPIKEAENPIKVLEVDKRTSEEAPRGRGLVLSNHIIENLDDHLDEARQLIKNARVQLAAEPPLFPEVQVRSEEAEAPRDHEQGLKDIQQDIKTVRAAVAQQNQPSPVVRTQIV